MKRNLYIDIDGVLLVSEYGLAPGAAEFIKTISDYGTPYWLTTHCRDGNGKWAVEYVNRAAGEADLRPWLESFIPTTWTDNKTEAIDFDTPFYWFDDTLYPGEKADLEKHDALNRQIRVDVFADPEDLQNKFASFKRQL